MECSKILSVRGIVTYWYIIANVPYYVIFQVPFILVAFFVHVQCSQNRHHFPQHWFIIIIRTSAPPLDLLGIVCNQQPSMSGVSQAPVAVGRIKGDRNCIFRSIDRNCISRSIDRNCIFRSIDRNCIFRSIDRNCIFRSIAQTLTGSQEDHEEDVNVILSCFIINVCYLTRCHK